MTTKQKIKSFLVTCHILLIKAVALNRSLVIGVTISNGRVILNKKTYVVDCKFYQIPAHAFYAKQP